MLREDWSHFVLWVSRPTVHLGQCFDTQQYSTDLILNRLESQIWAQFMFFNYTEKHKKLDLSSHDFTCHAKNWPLSTDLIVLTRVQVQCCLSSSLTGKHLSCCHHFYFFTPLVKTMPWETMLSIKKNINNWYWYTVPSFFISDCFAK